MNLRNLRRAGALALGLSMAASAALAAGPASQDRTVEVRHIIAAEDAPLSAGAPAAQTAAQMGAQMGASNAYLGAAPWICSPSGFGHRSKCFRRTSLRTRGR